MNAAQSRNSRLQPGDSVTAAFSSEGHHFLTVRACQHRTVPPEAIAKAEGEGRELTAQIREPFYPGCVLVASGSSPLERVTDSRQGVWEPLEDGIRW